MESLEQSSEETVLKSVLEAYYDDPSSDNLGSFFDALRDLHLILPVTSVQLVVDGEEEELYEYSPLMARGPAGETIAYAFLSKVGFDRFCEMDRQKASSTPEIEAMQMPSNELVAGVLKNEWDVISFDAGGPVPLTFTRSAFEQHFVDEMPADIMSSEDPEPSVVPSSSGVFQKIKSLFA